MVSLLYSEFIKFRRSKMLLISILGAMATPTIVFVGAIKTRLTYPDKVITLANLFSDCCECTILLCGLMVYTVFAAYLFSREYTENTLKTILTVPVSKRSFIISKFIILFIWIMMLSFATWGAMLLLATIFGVSGYTLNIVIKTFAQMMVGGILMYFTISPMVFLSIWFKGLVVPIITTTVVAVGNVFLCNESLAALYPWSSIYLLVCGNIEKYEYPKVLIIGLIALVSIVGFVASVVYLEKEDVK